MARKAARKPRSLGQRIDAAKTGDEVEKIVLRALAHRIVTTVTDPSMIDPSATRQLCEAFATVRGERTADAGFSLAEALAQAEKKGQQAREARAKSRGD